MTSEGESKTAYTLEEAMQHIYSIDEGAYKRLTGRSLEDVDFVLVKGSGMTEKIKVGENPLEMAIDTAIVQMYGNMKAQGVEFAINLKFEIFEYYNNTYPCVVAHATGIKRRDVAGESK